MSSQRVLNVGVVGCGLVAQCIHLPNLILASDYYKVTALCDISLESMRFCGSRFNVSNHFSTVSEMLASQTPIDLILILTANEYHASQTIECADAAKHVFVEKPMACTIAESDAIEEARQRNGVVIFVGYMRRYATALSRVQEALHGQEIKYVRVRDIIGRNPLFTEQSGMFLKTFSDFPKGSMSDMKARQSSNIVEAVGEEKAKDPSSIGAWAMLGGLASHDLVEGGWEVVECLFAYKGFKTYFEMAIDQVASFDAHIEIYTTQKRIKIQYDTPFVKGLPITITIQTNLPNGDFSTEIIRPTFVDPYTLEFQELYAAVVEGKDYKTTPMDAREDLVLNTMIMEALVD